MLMPTDDVRSRLDVGRISLSRKPLRNAEYGGQIDYEYPKTSHDADAYVSLLHELRGGLEELARSKGRARGQYQLTVAAPCGQDNMEILKVRAMDEVSIVDYLGSQADGGHGQVLDFWNLMVSGRARKLL